MQQMAGLNCPAITDRQAEGPADRVKHKGTEKTMPKGMCMVLDLAIQRTELPPILSILLPNDRFFHTRRIKSASHTGKNSFSKTCHTGVASKVRRLLQGHCRNNRRSAPPDGQPLEASPEQATHGMESGPGGQLQLQPVGRSR